jgi:hypothetical protein
MLTKARGRVIRGYELGIELRSSAKVGHALPLSLLSSPHQVSFSSTSWKSLFPYPTWTCKSLALMMVFLLLGWKASLTLWLPSTALRGAACLFQSAEASVEQWPARARMSTQAVHPYGAVKGSSPCDRERRSVPGIKKGSWLSPSLVLYMGNVPWGCLACPELQGPDGCL